MRYWTHALRASRTLGSIVRKGKQALGPADKDKIQIDASCSLALDKDGPTGAHGEKRWDYLLVVRRSEEAHAVEVHTATPGDVKELIAKKEWADSLLAAECPEHTVSKWHWVARTHVDFPRHRLRERERLIHAGIEYPRTRIML